MAAVVGPRLGACSPASDRRELLADCEWRQLHVTADLSDATIERLDVAECHFDRCRFTGSVLDGARLVDSVFAGCEFSGVALHEAVLTRVEFRDCRLSGAIFNAARIRDLTLVDCRADGLNLRMAAIERSRADRCLLSLADFSAARLTSLDLLDCDLTAADFSKARLDQVRLHGSVIAGLRGVADMRNVTIDAAQLPVFALLLMAAHDVAIADLESDDLSAQG